MSRQEAGGVSPGRVPQDHWASYVEYNKLLRSWFVSFGIGGPVLLLLNPGLLVTLKEDGLAFAVVGLFLAGCTFQIVIAMLNKTVAWYMYCSEHDTARRSAKWYARCERLSESYAIDLTLDILTLLAFVAAVLLLADINLGPVAAKASPAMPM